MLFHSTLAPSSTHMAAPQSAQRPKDAACGTIAASAVGPWRLEAIESLARRLRCRREALAVAPVASQLVQEGVVFTALHLGLASSVR